VASLLTAPSDAIKRRLQIKFQTLPHTS